jgi:predicted site-specific integrase-resolvase
VSDNRTDRTKLKVKEYAQREGVSPRTVWRWAEKGAVKITRKAPRTGVRVQDNEDGRAA